MTSDQYINALEYLGFDQKEFAALVDVTPRTTSRWASGARIPRSVAIIIRAAVAGKIELEDYAP
jgi:DNA-binding transcriptional regulator YdaS (Cro superfamily)